MDAIGGVEVWLAMDHLVPPAMKEVGEGEEITNVHKII